jgi:hypothetical protein
MEVLLALHSDLRQVQYMIVRMSGSIEQNILNQ